MAALSYYISLPFILLMSILPMPVLYFISDLLFPVNYYLIRYRKKVVLENLRNSFPDKDEIQIRTLARKFYRHFGDILVETFKLITISPERLQKRVKFTNPELFEHYRS